jgi:hypothetical protein
MASKTVPVRAPGKPPAAGLPNQTWVAPLVVYGRLLIICSLYCTNLSDKLRKQDLRLSLYTLFSTYGAVLDVVAVKTEKMRGQAHIVFKDVQASTQAMRALQGFEFFGKPMVYSSNPLALAKSPIANLYRKLSTPRAHPTLLLDFAELTMHQSQLPVKRQVYPQIFKSQSSVDLPGQLLYPRILPENPTEPHRDSNGLVKMKAMKRRLRWRRIVTCQWRHPRTRINFEPWSTAPKGKYMRTTKYVLHSVCFNTGYFPAADYPLSQRVRLAIGGEGSSLSVLAR